MHGDDAYAVVGERNYSGRLKPDQVAYIALIASPDARLVGQVFALEHAQTYLGRYACCNIWVVVNPKGPAIMTRRNTLIEFADDRFWVVDPSSTYRTSLNGERLVPQQRYPLSVGDAIDVGGAPDESGRLHGHARVVFRGATLLPSDPPARHGRR
jgi:hypothetical protein